MIVPRWVTHGTPVQQAGIHRSIDSLQPVQGLQTQTLKMTGGGHGSQQTSAGAQQTGAGAQQCGEASKALPRRPA